MTFDDNRRIVIRGAMETWETGRRRGETNRAKFVSLTLKQVLHETWSIVIYDYNYIEEAGFGPDTVLRYYTLLVFGVPTVSTSCDKEGIVTRLKDGLGWGSVSDIGGLLIGAKRAIIEKFGEGWSVHVAKLPPGSHWSSDIYGAHWEHDGYHLWVMRQSP
jgi:hypothetical protein